MGDSVNKRVEEVRPRGRPSLLETQSITDSIIKAAQTEFLTVGYDRTTFERIAQFGGTTRTAIYSRFSDKPTLFAEVFARVSADVCSTGLMGDPLSDSLPFRQGLALLGERLLDRATDRRWLRLYEIGWGHCRHHPKMVASTTAIWRHYVSQTEAYLVDSMKQGRIGNIDTESSADILVKLLFADIHVSVIYGPALSRGQDRVDQISCAVDLFIRLLAQQAEPTAVAATSRN